MFKQITGRRKTAVAQLFIRKSLKQQGQIWIKLGPKTVSPLPCEKYFLANPFWIANVEKPIVLTKVRRQYDVFVKLKGGGIAAQADAIGHGLARFLAKLSPANHQVLKAAKLLTRDARKKERKKYGLKKARKAPQFSKR